MRSSQAADAPLRFVWAMGLSNAAYGFAYAVVLVTMPQVLAAHGVREPVIAGLTALAGAMSLGTFAVAPILDTLISRRAWAVSLGLLAAALSAITLGLSPLSPLIAPLLMIDALVFVMLTTALGGWLGAALPKTMDSTIGAWFTVGNGLGFGVGALCQYALITALPAPLGQLSVGALVLAPLVVLPLIPTPVGERKAVRESFGDLARDLTLLLRQPLVMRIALMFAAPCAAFTLTNAFGGLGPDFHVSAAVVDSANGFGATVVGMGAALVGRWCLRHVHAPVLYLGIGTLGAVFTALIVGLPHTAAIYLLAIVAENASQSIAQVSQNAIVFGSIRRGSPLAASQFGLLTTMALLPYSYMQALDGYGYHLASNVAGSFWMDAGVSLTACAILAIPVMRWMRAGRLAAPKEEDAPVDEPALAPGAAPA